MWNQDQKLIDQGKDDRLWPGGTPDTTGDPANSPWSLEVESGVAPIGLVEDDLIASDWDEDERHDNEDDDDDDDDDDEDDDDDDDDDEEDEDDVEDPYLDDGRDLDAVDPVPALSPSQHVVL